MMTPQKDYLNKLKQNNEVFAVRNKLNLIFKTIIKKLNKNQNEEKTNFAKLIESLIDRKLESSVGGLVVVTAYFVARATDTYNIQKQVLV